eukprot:8140142-Pyramimonas_sp.AAC.1
MQETRVYSHNGPIISSQILLSPWWRARCRDPPSELAATGGSPGQMPPPAPNTATSAAPPPP